MSYIDQFEHQEVALFGGIPVYRPLEPIPGWEDPRDFACGPDQLVIGGGAGEFPGVVLTDPAGAAADFALEDAALLDDDNPLKAAWLAAAAPFAGRKVLDFAGWEADEVAGFATACAKELPLQRRYVPGHDGDFAHWLGCCLGEFVVYALPEIGRAVTGQLPFLPEGPGHVPFYLRYGNLVLRAPYRPLLVTDAPVRASTDWALEPPPAGARPRRVGESGWAIAPFAPDPDPVAPPRVVRIFDASGPGAGDD